MLSSLPTPFINVAIGAPATPGSAVYSASNNQWQIAGAGTGISGTSDQFDYASESWVGSGSVQADVGSIANAGAGAQAGVMIRDTSAAGSDFAAVVENSNGGVTFEYRAATGANVVAISTVNPISPAWVRLTESQSGNGDSFTGQYSTDGVHWVTINATPVNISFTSSANLAGLAVTSGNVATATTVNVNSFSTDSTLDAATLTSDIIVLPGSTQNIADGLTLANGATITVDAGGTLNFLDGTSNVQTISGSGTITLDAASGSYAAAQINVNGANSGSQVTFANGVNIAGPGSVNVGAGNTVALADTVTRASITASAGAGIQLYAMTLQNAVMNINPSATLTLENDNQYLINSSLINSGVVNVVSGLWVYFEDGASITNAAGGVFTVTNDDWFQPGIYNDPSSMTFNNAGVLNINTPASTSRPSSCLRAVLTSYLKTQEQ